MYSTCQKIFSSGPKLPVHAPVHNTSVNNNFYNIIIAPTVSPWNSRSSLLIYYRELTFISTWAFWNLLARPEISKTAKGTRTLAVRSFGTRLYCNTPKNHSFTISINKEKPKIQSDNPVTTFYRVTTVKRSIWMTGILDLVIKSNVR